MTRSREQKSGCEGLERNAKPGVVTPEATYVLVYAHNAFASPETCT
ncbi:Malolactic regulator [Lactobacillus rhamnosus]|nr:Malolactic regulator [Lacticaseibacillus rhamnosus]